MDAKDGRMTGKLKYTSCYMIVTAEKNHIDLFIAGFVLIIAVTVDILDGSLYHVRGDL